MVLTRRFDTEAGFARIWAAANKLSRLGQKAVVIGT